MSLLKSFFLFFILSTFQNNQADWLCNAIVNDLDKAITKLRDEITPEYVPLREKIEKISAINNQNYGTASAIEGMVDVLENILKGK